MAQENSVLFALRDLRTLESDRVAEEARVEAARRRAEEERRRAEEERRRVEEEARLLAQRRADDAAAEMARALRESAGRNQQLESDVQTLRALVSAVQPPPPRARSHWPALLVAAAALALAGALWSATRPPIVRERVVYAPAPVAPTPVAAPAEHPAVTPPSPPRVEPARPKRPAVHVHKTAPASPSELPSILDCMDKKDPLCGTKL